MSYPNYMYFYLATNNLRKGFLSSDAGLVLVKEFLHLIGFEQFIITNLYDGISAERVYQTYWKRGVVENFIQDAKNGFFFGKTDTSHFLEITVRMMARVLYYNINNCMSPLLFPDKAKGLQIKAIRLRFSRLVGN